MNKHNQISSQLRQSRHISDDLTQFCAPFSCAASDPLQSPNIITFRIILKSGAAWAQCRHNQRQGHSTILKFGGGQSINAIANSNWVALLAVMNSATSVRGKALDSWTAQKHGAMTTDQEVIGQMKLKLSHKLRQSTCENSLWQFDMFCVYLINVCVWQPVQRTPGTKSDGYIQGTWPWGINLNEDSHPTSLYNLSCFDLMQSAMATRAWER